MNPSVKVDLEKHSVSVDGKFVNLTPKEYGLLVELANARGRVKTRTDLLTKIWGGNYAQLDTRTVDQHIARLRQKLKRYGADPIFTVTNVGYKSGGVNLGPEADIVGTVKKVRRFFKPKPGATITFQVDGFALSVKDGDKLRLA